MEFEDMVSNKADNYSGVQISIASPEAIKLWSHGEVKKPETINYRTFKPEKNGLFCPKIFGPVKDYECACGKYKRLKHRGIVCEKCGVEVTTSKLRRERMAHIDLASPVVHIWFLRSTPSRIGMILDMSIRDIDRVLYYESHVVVSPGAHPLKMGQTLTGEDLSQLRQAEYVITALRSCPEEGIFFNLETEEDVNRAVAFFISEEVMSQVKDYWYKHLLPAELVTKFSLQNVMSGKTGISEPEARQMLHSFMDAKKGLEKEQAAYDAKVSESGELGSGGKLKEAMDNFQSVKKEFEQKFAKHYKTLGLKEIPTSDKKIRDAFKQLSKSGGADKKAFDVSRDNLTKGDAGKEHAALRKLYKEAEKNIKKVEAEGEEVPPHLKDAQERLVKAKEGLKKSQSNFAKIIKKVTFTEKEIKTLTEADESFEIDYTYGMGAEAIYDMLKSIDLKSLSEELKTEMQESSSSLKKAKIAKRRKICETFRKSNNRPEWMVLKTIPVLPPDLRPLVPHGGRFATSDLNVLYRRVINRNNRLKRLLELDAPDIIVRNEKRMLQEAVDALFENGRRGRPVLGHNHRPLKSLTDIIKGKSGRFRQNLLGKRVDYSGRSVITVGPDLKLHQCGLPKQMALELFKPFIYQKLQELKNKDGSPIAPTIKIAKKFVETGAPVVWDALDDVIKEHLVMLNRAPTLHKLSIQAFEPVLVEDRSIRVHPLVCPAYNADFDGDQMAVHLPLSIEAQAECRTLVMSTNNILSPAHGKPVILPTQDIVLGIYYMTKDSAHSKGEGKYFSSPEEVIMAYDSGHIGIHTLMKIKINDELVETTVGRVILYDEAIPKTIPFKMVNKPMNKGEVENLVDTCFRKNGGKETVVMADRIRTLGFKYATKSGISISINDMEIPESKEKIVEEAREEELKVHGQYSQGLLTDGERYNKVVDIWTKASDEIAEDVMENIKFETVKDDKGVERTSTSSNPIYMMIDSGARGSMSQMRQLAGMRGLMAKGDDTIIEKPITSNFREGLKVMDYFLSTYGARKGLADTALKTANAGYLTRKLIDVAHDIIVQEEECGTIEGLIYTNEVDGGKIKKRVGDRVLGRVVLDDLKDPETGEIIVKGGNEIDNDASEKINQSSINEVKIRSVLTCDTEEGICRLCYGRNLSTGKIVDIGEAVGIMAAQSIGEPGTQLTMRTFHVGGEAKAEVATLENNHLGTVSLSNVETVELQPGALWRVINRNGRISIVDEKGYEKETHKLEQGAILKVKDGQKVKWEQNKEDGKVENETLAEWDPYTNQYIAESSGTIQWKDLEEGKNFRQQPDEITGILKIEVVAPPTGIKELAKLNPTIIIRSGKNSKQEFGLPVGAIIEKNSGEKVVPGDIVAKIPKKRITKDITGGLPRVAELFEARVPKDKNLAIVSEIDGTVSFGEDVKGKRRILVNPQIGEEKEYIVPKGKHIIVSEGDFVVAGDKIVDGDENPHDILKIKGEKTLSEFLVKEIQSVYELQGVRVNDKHIEVIVRQMLKRVKIKDPGDTTMIPGESVTKSMFHKENAEVEEQGGKPAAAEPLLLGITRSSLITESWLSAASFQETTKILTEAACESKEDKLKGLKENVILGRLIPAGTGLNVYKNIKIETEDQAVPMPLVEEAKSKQIKEKSGV
ncbi:DNA-directed RNA polymerase subunit beta' [Candidatus Mycalebacterium sp.]